MDDDDDDRNGDKEEGGGGKRHDKTMSSGAGVVVVGDNGNNNTRGGGGGGDDNSESKERMSLADDSGGDVISKRIYNIIQEAADQGRDEPADLIVDLIRQHESLEIDSYTDSKGWTSLLLASSLGFERTVSVLLEPGGANIHHAEDGDTDVYEMLWDVFNGRLLFELQADAQHATRNPGSTALLLASQNGHEAVVWLLLDANADVNHARDDGGTALIVASQNGHDAVVRLLLESNADVHHTDNDGDTVLMMASQNLHPRLAHHRQHRDHHRHRRHRRHRDHPRHSLPHPRHRHHHDGHEAVVRLLLESEADVNHARSDGVTALMIASQNGHEPVVRLLLDANADLNHADNDGNTALTMASRYGHEPVVRLLLEFKADVHHVLNDGDTALTMASFNGNESVVRLLLESKADVNHADTDDNTALMMASDNGHEAVVQLLLESKADVNHAGINGATALMVAAQNGHEAVVRLLLESKADVHYADSDGNTALMMASQNGHEPVVRLLLESKADVNHARNNGVTALMFASHRGHEAVVRLLLESKADVHHAANVGDAALILASQNGHEAVVRLLLESKADVHQIGNGGDTALIVASQNGNEAVVRLLLESKADVNHARNDDVTALMMASQNGHEAVVRLLLESKADVNHATRDPGFTALLLASINGHEVVVRLLLESKADVDHADNDGVTALIWASRNGHEAVVHLLLGFNADVDHADNDGVTALIWASQSGHEAVIYVLLGFNADVNHADNDGDTALMMASNNGHEAFVRLLLDANADVNHARNNGLTALMIASLQGHEDVVRLLLDSKAETNHFDSEGKTALYYALFGGHKIIADLFHGDYNLITDEDRRVTQLFLAAEYGHEDVLEYFIKAGADLNLPDNKGTTPLLVASRRSHYNIVTTLLNAGADLSNWMNRLGQNEMGENCLHLCVQSSEENVNMIIQNLPHASQQEDKNGQFPLHTAMRLACDKGNVCSIYDSYPEALQVSDNNGKTPLQLGLENRVRLDTIKFVHQKLPNAFEQVNSQDGSTMLQVALTNGAHPKVANQVLLYYPGATRKVNQRGESALCTAVAAVLEKSDSMESNQLQETIALTECILEKNPAAAEESPKTGLNPIQRLVAAVRQATTRNLALKLLHTFVNRGAIKDARSLDTLFSIGDQSTMRSLFLTLQLCDDLVETDVPVLDLDVGLVGGASLLEVLVDMVERSDEPSESAAALLTFLSDVDSLDPPQCGSGVPVTFHLASGENIDLKISRKASSKTMERVADKAKWSTAEKLSLWGTNYGRLFDKYRINKDRGYYKSDTSIVIFASESVAEVSKNIGDDKKTTLTREYKEVDVALKFMAMPEQLVREVNARTEMTKVVGSEGAEKLGSFVAGFRECFSRLSLAELESKYLLQGTVKLKDEEKLNDKVNVTQEISRLGDFLHLQTSHVEMQHMIVMDSGQGGDLFEASIQRNFQPKQVIEIARDIALVLQYLNERCKIVHGDVKAKNFVLRDLTVLAIDFDNAASIRNNELVGQKRTSTGYLPPEQAKCELQLRLRELGVDEFSIESSRDEFAIQKQRLQEKLNAGKIDLDKYVTLINEQERRHERRKAAFRFHEQQMSPVTATRKYDMWCFGVMLYAMCMSGQGLVPVDNHENVTDTTDASSVDNLRIIAEWSCDDTKNRVAGLPPGYKSIKSVLENVLQPNPNDRPYDWGEIISLLDKTEIVEGMKQIKTEIVDEIKAVVDVMFQAKNIRCPYIFQIIDEEAYHKFKLNALRNKTTPERGTANFAEQFTSFIENNKDMLELGTKVLEGGGHHLDHATRKARDELKSRVVKRLKSTKVHYLQLLCGLTFKPMVTYKLEAVQWDKRVVKFAKLGAKVLHGAALFGAVLNCASAVVQVLGSPVSVRIPTETMQLGKKRLEEIVAEHYQKSPWATLMKQMPSDGMTVRDIDNFGQFVLDLERKKALCHLGDVFESEDKEGWLNQDKCFNAYENENGKWSRVLMQQVVSNGGGVTYISKDESQKFQARHQAVASVNPAASLSGTGTAEDGQVSSQLPELPISPPVAVVAPSAFDNDAPPSPFIVWEGYLRKKSMKHFPGPKWNDRYIVFCADATLLQYENESKRLEVKITQGQRNHRNTVKKSSKVTAVTALEPGLFELTVRGKDRKDRKAAFWAETEQKALECMDVIQQVLPPLS